MPEQVIEKRGGKHYVRWGEKEFGPWDWVDAMEFTCDRQSWMVRVKSGGKLYMLIDGVAHGPFDSFGRERWFTMTHNAFVCTVIRGREIFLIENGRMDKKGEIVDKNSATFLEIGGRSFGPYKKVTDLLFGAGGRHWTADVEKQGRWHGFNVDGVEYGPYPRQFFGACFSPDGKRWFVALDRERENSVCSFILDGKTYGRFRIGEMGFCNENRFYYSHTRREKYFAVFEGREIGPFLHDDKDFEMTWEFSAIMGYVRNGREKPRRCVIYFWIAQENRRVYFSANSGEALEDAIEVINAGDTNTGVWAEHQYMRLVLTSRNLTGESGEQRLLHREGRYYDQLIYKVGKCKKISLFFDITSFYGKSNEAE